MAIQKKSALGRGLDALISLEEVKVSGGSSINEVELSRIVPNPDQPRKEFDPVALQELAESIKVLGIIQPITVQRVIGTDDYMIIAGERRYRASLLAGLDSIPAYVREVSDQTVLEMALVENIQREDLNPIEVSLAYQNMIEQYGLTQEKVGERVGVNRSTVTNYIRLLRLPAEVQMGIRDRKIDMGHARALLAIDEASALLKVYERIIAESLSVRKVEEIARTGNYDGDGVAPSAKKASSGKKSGLSEEYSVMQKHLSKKFGSKVKFACKENGSGKITIPFASDEDLERIVRLIESMN